MEGYIKRRVASWGVSQAVLRSQNVYSVWEKKKKKKKKKKKSLFILPTNYYNQTLRSPQTAYNDKKNTNTQLYMGKNRCPHAFFTVKWAVCREIFFFFFFFNLCFSYNHE
jgi:hypothetical protein